MTTAAQLRAQITTSTLLLARYRTQLLRLPDRLLEEIAALSRAHPERSAGRIFADVAPYWSGIVTERCVLELRKVIGARHSQRQETGRLYVGQVMLGPFVLGAWYAGSKRAKPRQLLGMSLGDSGEPMMDYRAEGTSEVCRMPYDAWTRWARKRIDEPSAKSSQMRSAVGCGAKSAA